MKLAFQYSRLLVKNGVENIRYSKDMLIFADKTSNLYEMTSNQYIKLLPDNITKSYQKSDPHVKKQLDMESKCLAKSVNLNKKMECYANRPHLLH